MTTKERTLIDKQLKYHIKTDVLNRFISSSTANLSGNKLRKMLIVKKNARALRNYYIRTILF